MIQRIIEKEQIYSIEYYLYLFVCGSMLGWCLEFIFRTICIGSLANPGFLNGPYCPIYGIAFILITLLCHHKNKMISFAKIYVFTTVLEYITAILLELIFHKTLWDYSSMPLSTGSRINLLFSLIWGILGVFVLFKIIPNLKNIYFQKQQTMKNFVYFVMFIQFLDFIYVIVTI